MAKSVPPSTGTSPVSAGALLEEVDALARELHPGRRRKAFSLETLLEREAGIDSLARVELLLRLERRFGLTLPEHGISAAVKIEDLLEALGRAAPGRAPGTLEREVPAVPAPEADGGMPERAATLVEALEWHASLHPDRPHIVFYGDGGEREVITYGELLREAEGVAGGLASYDLAPRQPVALMLQTCRDYFRGFFGILMAGGIPVPLYPPARPAQIEEHARRQAGILVSCRAPLMLTSGEVTRAARILRGLAPDLRAVVPVPEVAAQGGRPTRMKLEEKDIAFLQYTSGSTGDPKGVILTHANLLANIRAMVEASGVGGTDVFVSWLPLYHDLGLIGAWLGSLYFGARAVLMSPLTFLARPPRWLRAIHRERGTVSAAPNFAYDLCASKIPESELEGLDLSCWRFALNGAEMVHMETMERFCARFARYGFRREAMMPVYGLAENSLGLAFPPPGRGPRADRVRREAFERGAADAAGPEDARALTFVSCGRPIPGHEIRIVDASGREVGEREQGRLQFRGPSATSGYYRNPEATRRLIRGGWVDSGDTAYAAGGEIHIVGRAKDLVIRAGRNIHPQELEAAVGEIRGIRRGCVAVFGVADRATGTERLVVLAETREEDPGARGRLVEAVNAAAADLLGTPADEVVLAPPRTVLKTPSGKIRRGACRELYEGGKLGAARPSVGMQLARLAAAGLGPAMRRLRRGLATSLYALYARIAFLAVALFAWPMVLIAPGLRRRRALVRTACRAVLRLTGVRVSVAGMGSIPPVGPCVIAANHASYIDSLVMCAILPPRFAYVVKGELTGLFIPRLFLRAVGNIFVERFDPGRSSRDAMAVVEAVRRGEPVVVFAEGTFGRAPGLRPFRMGAFVTAAQTGAPVVPVALRGTRSILRDVDWYPRRGAVAVTVFDPVRPEGTGWPEAVRLRERTRERILRACGEPDLAGESILPV